MSFRPLARDPPDRPLPRRLRRPRGPNHPLRCRPLRNPNRRQPRAGSTPPRWSAWPDALPGHSGIRRSAATSSGVSMVRPGASTSCPSVASCARTRAVPSATWPDRRERPRTAFREEADDAPALEFYFPVPAHRARWQGDENILVATAWADGDAPVAFDTRGNRLVLSPDTPPDTPVLALEPVETDFNEVAASDLRRELQPLPGAAEGVAGRRSSPAQPQACTSLTAISPRHLRVG